MPINKEISINRNITELNNELVELESSRIEYNSKFDQIDETRRELLRINKEIAYHEIIDDYNLYIKQNENKEKEDVKLSKILEDIRKLEDDLKFVQDEQKSIRIAVDYINKGLKYVFFSPNRLSIQTEKDRYVLFSNGRHVRPQDISCGERNILALCYYFTLTMSNLNKIDLYKKEVLLVIDDPVSSFDLENKVGILSYLKSQLLEVAKGNLNSRVIIFTHDLSTTYDLIKQFEEIQSAIKSMNKESKNNFTTNFTKLELENFSLKDFPYNSRNEYTLMLETIYSYANSTDDGNNLAIGNIMRRVLEAFTTFEYKKDIAAVSCDKEILDSMGNEKYSQYFENLMYRLILNGESHSSDHVKSLQDLNFYSTVSTEEKRRTAKDVLCLINILNPKHLASHFSKNAKKINEINKWCDSILNM